MRNKNFLYLFGVLIIIFAYCIFANTKTPSENNSGNSTTTSSNSITTVSPHVYVNKEYGFSFTLPKGWEGYSIIEDEWEGDSLDNFGQMQPGTENGPLVSIRHPDWDYKSPRQDIPIMVFTLKQWADMQADKFHIGAAPINPTELARNKKYVFAIPARYNFSYLIGYEEVDQIIKSDPIKTF